MLQLKGFGQIIAINLFDALMQFMMRALYVIYDEWFMQLQYGNRAAKAIIATEEENYLRTFEAQAESFASAPSVFVTGGLLLLGHFQPVPGELVHTSKVIIDIVVQLCTNFVSDWVSNAPNEKHSQTFPNIPMPCHALPQQPPEPQASPLHNISKTFQTTLTPPLHPRSLVRSSLPLSLSLPRGTGFHW